MNPYMYNPAYAGVEGHAALFVMYRQQWANIDGAPQTFHASFHVPMRGGVSIGGAAFNTTQGLLTTSAGKVSAGYLLNFDQTHFLRFGLSVGGGINSVNITEFDSPNDPAFNNFLDQNSFLIGDFGLTYHFGHFNAGFAIPNLFTYDVVTQTKFAPVRVTPLDNIMFKVNYRGHITDNFALEPHIIYRYSQVLPHQFETTLIAHLKHIVWVGGSYRQDAGFIGLVGAKIEEKIGIGFAYEMGNSNISTNLGPTFEINIGYHLGTKKDHSSHSSSFIKSHRYTAEERAAMEAERLEAERLEQERLEAERLEQERLEQERLEQERLEQEQLEQERAEQERLERLQQERTEQERLAQLEQERIERLKEELAEQERLKKLTEERLALEEELTRFQTPTEENIDETLTDDTRSLDEITRSDRSLIVTRGRHLLELPAGNYVIAGTFLDFEDADAYSDEVFLYDKFYETLVGYVSARGYYYVVVHRESTLQRAEAYRDQLRKRKGFSKVFVLQVNEQ